MAVNLQEARPGAGHRAGDGAQARHRTSKGRLRRALRRVPPIQGLLPLVAGLLLWQFLFKGSALFPPPSAWWGGTVELWDEGSLGSALGGTVFSFLGGLLLATVIGALLGMGVGRSRFLDRLLGPVFDFCRVLPAPAIVPLAVLFAGYTENSKLAVIVYASIWPVLLQVRTGARRLPLTLIETARTLRLGRWARLTKILLPAARHDILLGLRVAAPIALIATLLVELLTAIGGLGALVGRAESSFHAAQVFALIVLCGILGVLVSFAVTASESDEGE